MSHPAPQAGAKVNTRSGAAWLRRDAERISGALPPLMAEAERLAASVVAGVHGRRRAGPGETFWQYRQAMPGDPASAVDWRRSARSDHLYIREMEWEAAQTVSIWADDAQAMDYRSSDAPRSKRDRAALLALALAVLLIRGGERVSLLRSDAERPLSGETQLRRMGAALSKPPKPRPKPPPESRAESRAGSDVKTAANNRADFGVPPRRAYLRGGKAVFLSDFMGDGDAIFPALAHAAERGVTGCTIQIVDPAEESFPFDGRLVFESLGGGVEFETHRARGLKQAYQARLAERRAALRDMARRCGWRCMIHRTSDSPRIPLLWLYAAMAGQ